MNLVWLDPALERVLYQAGFYLLAMIAVFSATMVVTLRNLVHLVIFLAATLLSVAGLFLYLNAHFLAMVQIFLYVGGVTVLFLFAVMLTSGIADPSIRSTNDRKLPALLACAALFAVLYPAVSRAAFPQAAGNFAAGDVTDSLGVALLTKYVLPFEIASLLLLAALIGAVTLAKEEAK